MYLWFNSSWTGFLRSSRRQLLRGSWFYLMYHQSSPILSVKTNLSVISFHPLSGLNLDLVPAPTAPHKFKGGMENDRYTGISLMYWTHRQKGKYFTPSIIVDGVPTFRIMHISGILPRTVENQKGQELGGCDGSPTVVEKNWIKKGNRYPIKFVPFQNKPSSLIYVFWKRKRNFNLPSSNWFYRNNM